MNKDQKDKERKEQLKENERKIAARPISVLIPIKILPVTKTIECWRPKVLPERERRREKR